MLSSHRFLCLPLRLPAGTVPCRIVLASPDDCVTCPYHFSLCLFTEVRRSLLYSCIKPIGINKQFQAGDDDDDDDGCEIGDVIDSCLFMSTSAHIPEVLMGTCVLVMMMMMMMILTVIVCCLLA